MFRALTHVRAFNDSVRPRIGRYLQSRG